MPPPQVEPALEAPSTRASAGSIATQGNEAAPCSTRSATTPPNCAIISAAGGWCGRPMSTSSAATPLCLSRRPDRGDGVAAGVLNHPGIGVAWLANRLHPWGESLKAGEVILSGSFIWLLAAMPGQQTFHADFGEMGSVACRFA